MSDALGPAERAMIDRYVGAFDNNDMAELSRMLRDDVVLEMPPALLWFAGRANVVEFFATKANRGPGAWRTIVRTKKAPARP